MASSAREIVLVVPDDAELPSGGNLYNAGLLRGLAKLAVPHRDVRAAALAGAVASFPPGAEVVLDSVLVDRAPELRARLGAESRLWLLVHDLPILHAAAPPAELIDRTRLTLEPFDGLVVPGALIAPRLEPLVAGKAVIVVPPALVMEPSRRFPFPEDGFYGVMPASLIPSKGVLPFLVALDGLMPADLSLTIDVFGREDLDPDYTIACRNLVRPFMRPERIVRLCGPVPPQRLKMAYAKASVFLSASEHETYGMALHEARAFGLPILALDRPHARFHVQNPRQGQLVPDPVELVISCLALAGDRDRLQAFQRSAFAERLIERRGWPDAARELVSALAAAASLG